MSKRAIFWVVLAFIALLLVALDKPNSESVSDLHQRVSALEMNTIKVNDYVMVSSMNQNFSSINTSSGIFLVSLAKVEPYLDGYKLYFHIGNPMMMRCTGFDLDIRYGKEYQSIMGYDLWQKSLKHIQITLPNELSPGVWNKIEAVLSPATADDIKHIEVKISPNTVVLMDAQN